MRNLQKLNQTLTKLFPFLIMAGLIGGIFLGESIIFLQFLVPFIFGFVTFIGSLNMNFNAFKSTLLNPLPILCVLVVLRILMPLWALLVGSLLFQNDVYTTTGLILFALLPTGINSAVWVIMYKGNIPLSLSVILIDTLLSPFVLPLSLALLTGQNIEMNVTSLMTSLVQMVVIPSLLGMLLNQLTKGGVTRKWSPKLAPLAKIGLIIVVIINGAMVAPYFTTIDFNLILIMASILFLSLSGYLFSWVIANLLKLKREETVTSVFTGGMRNVSTGIVIAVAHFPSQVAVPVITAILFQQTINAVLGQLMERYYLKKAAKEYLTKQVME